MVLGDNYQCLYWVVFDVLHGKRWWSGEGYIMERTHNARGQEPEEKGKRRIGWAGGEGWARREMVGERGGIWWGGARRDGVSEEGNGEEWEGRGDRGGKCEEEWGGTGWDGE
jgi:hypothetical protein